MIKVGFVDFWPGFDVSSQNHYLFELLKNNFDIKFDNNDPDFVFCSIFGTDVFNYSCPRICIIGEAASPSFNIYDYVIGFDRIIFDDRYIRVPNYAFVANKALYIALNNNNKKSGFYSKRKRFCNYIVSNPNSNIPRDLFFNLLNQRKHVDSAGSHLNNMPSNKNCTDKIKFQENYRFSIAFENSLMDGYVTEKIVDAFAAGTVPIYYGGNNVEADFNEKAFIDVSKFSSFEECIDYILWLDENEDEYMKIIMEPFATPEQIIEFDYDKKIIDFLRNIFYKQKDKIRRSADISVFFDRISHSCLINNNNDTNKDSKRPLSKARKIFSRIDF